MKELFHLRLFLFFILLLATPSSGCSGNMSPAETGQQVRNHLNKLQSLTFTFSQRTGGQMSGRPRQASGTAYFLKEGEMAKMRWDYSAPEKQVILSDGETLSMYFESLNQLIITPADSLQQDVIYSFFTTKGDILKDFIVEGDLEKQGEKSEFTHLKLIPQAQTQVREINLWVTNKVQIKRIEIIDNFDTKTLINISNIEENSLLKAGKLIYPNLFLFTPPKGTEIIHQ